LFARNDINNDRNNLTETLIRNTNRRGVVMVNRFFSMGILSTNAILSGYILAFRASISPT
jgi:hypothetical protein